MANQSKLIERLINELTKMPGIGRKTAQRLTYFLLKAPDDYVSNLAHLLNEIKEHVKPCRECGNLTEVELCAVCADETRNRQLICAVEDPADIALIERTGEFNGVYHVLMGVISPLEGIGPDQLRLGELVKRVQTGRVVEVIVATDPDVEGDTTAYYIAKLLSPLGVKATRIARGLPVGGDLDFADEVTLAKAIAGRQEIEE
ncbi:MAG: recombination protein RecR [candidate division Zixibacteria bacterium]|nr:recombination protein RecR [candidate division Zixibacteria bacterium]